jgi:transcriptional regulator with XRE-family HTH domain
MTRTTAATTLRRRLRLAIEQGQVSQRELCRRLNVTTTTMQNWLNGVYVPDAVQLFLLGQELGVSTEYFFSPKAKAADLRRPLEMCARELKRIADQLQ